jgi:hypothetical protein
MHSDQGPRPPVICGQLRYRPPPKPVITGVGDPSPSIQSSTTRLAIATLSHGCTLSVVQVYCFPPALLQLLCHLGWPNPPLSYRPYAPTPLCLEVSQMPDHLTRVRSSFLPIQRPPTLSWTAQQRGARVNLVQKYVEALWAESHRPSGQTKLLHQTELVVLLIARIKAVFDPTVSTPFRSLGQRTASRLSQQDSILTHSHGFLRPCDA